MYLAVDEPQPPPVRRRIWQWRPQTRPCRRRVRARELLSQPGPPDARRRPELVLLQLDARSLPLLPTHAQPPMPDLSADPRSCRGCRASSPATNARPVVAASQHRARRRPSQVWTVRRLRGERATATVAATASPAAAFTGSGHEGRRSGRSGPGSGRNVHGMAATSTPWLRPHPLEEGKKKKLRTPRRRRPGSPHGLCRQLAQAAARLEEEDGGGCGLGFRSRPLGSDAGAAQDGGGWGRRMVAYLSITTDELESSEIDRRNHSEEISTLKFTRACFHRLPAVADLGAAIGLPARGSPPQADHIYSEVLNEFTHGKRGSVSKSEFQRVLSDILLGMAAGLKRDPIVILRINGADLNEFLESPRYEPEAVALFSQLESGNNASLRQCLLAQQLTVDHGMPPASDSWRLQQHPVIVAHTENTFDGSGIRKLLSNKFQVDKLLDSVWKDVPKEHTDKTSKKYIRVALDRMADSACLPPYGAVDQLDGNPISISTNTVVHEPMSTSPSLSPLSPMVSLPNE
ncbi:hypothetical protein EJB05_22906, partial [Eragrostis curvula]